MEKKTNKAKLEIFKIMPYQQILCFLDGKEDK